MRCPRCAEQFIVFPATCPRCGEEVILAGRYAIRSLIGRGGMGEVYLAVDQKLTNEVAIKRVPAVYAEDPALRQALVREARILANLTDDSIVRMFDLAETPDGLFLILEYVCGPSLMDMLNKGYRPGMSDIVRIFTSVAKGLETAHSNDVIHRDLKPANLLVQLYGDERRAFRESGQYPRTLANARVKITDFGIAKPGASTAMPSEMASGTPAFMAPEQFRGEKASRETDVYAMGVIAYVLITGRLPFDANNLAYCHLMVEPPPIPDCPAAVNAAVLRALEKRREDRFRSASEFLIVLRKAVEKGDAAEEAARPRQPRISDPSLRPQPPQPPPPLPPQPPPPPPRPWSFELKLALMIAAAFLITLLLVTIFRKAGPDANTAGGRFDVPTPGIELRGLPFVQEPPPVVESAKGGISLDGVAGPGNPKVDWTIASPFGSPTLIGGMTTDGTVYISGGDGIGAVRDGRFIWAYKLRSSGSGLMIPNDGRIWVRTFNSGFFCLNRDGQGGLLPESFKPPAGAERRLPGCREDRTAVVERKGGGETLAHMKYDCSYAGPVMFPDGNMLVGTEEPALHAIRPDGSTAWKAGIPCSPHAMAAGAGGNVFFVCEDHSLHGVRNGQLSWTHPGDAEVFNGFGGIVLDAHGTAYFIDSPRGTAMAHVHAVSATGDALWTLSLSGVSLSDLKMDPQGRLYSGGMQGMKNAIFRFADAK